MESVSGRPAGLQTGGQAARAGRRVIRLSRHRLGPTRTTKGEIMATKSHSCAVLTKQYEALDELGVAYVDAKAFTEKVLQMAFGEPPREGAWPPPGIAQSEADSRLREVQDFLWQKEDEVRKVLGDVKETQRRLVASGFDVPRSWIIVDPLGKFPCLCGGSQVARVVRSALAQDTALEEVLGQIDIDMRLLEGKIAAKPDEDEGKGGAPKTRKTRKKRSDPKADKIIAEAWGTGQYQTEAALAAELKTTERDVHLARDRHRKREDAKKKARRK